MVGDTHGEPPSSYFLGPSESIKIWGVCGILGMCSLFAPRLISIKNKSNNPKGCLMVTVVPSYLDHGKQRNVVSDTMTSYILRALVKSSFGRFLEKTFQSWRGGGVL